MILAGPQKQADCLVWVLSEGDRFIAFGISGLEERLAKIPRRLILAKKIIKAREQLRSGMESFPVQHHSHFKY